MTFISYAQNGEDVLLHRVFGGQETGFYLDVGAYHPVEGSVTKAFYDRGWSGINVEPGSVFEKLAEARPRDVNLKMAVLDRTGTARFQENQADRGMSCVVGESGAVGGREVPCDTLENIARLHGDGRPVDFLKVDAEGAEGAIVASTDWRRFRPRVLVFEATLPWSSVLSNGAWEPLLIEGGYVRIFFDGINCFYIPEEARAALGPHFEVPVNVLDGVERYNGAAVAIREAEREVERRAASAVEAALAEAHAALASALAERDLARAQARAAEVHAEVVAARLAAAEAERLATEGRLRAESTAVEAERARPSARGEAAPILAHGALEGHERASVVQGN